LGAIDANYLETLADFDRLYPALEPLIELLRIDPKEIHIAL